MFAYHDVIIFIIGKRICFVIVVFVKKNRLKDCRKHFIYWVYDHRRWCVNSTHIFRTTSSTSLSRKCRSMNLNYLQSSLLYTVTTAIKLLGASCRLAAAQHSRALVECDRWTWTWCSMDKHRHTGGFISSWLWAVVVGIVCWGKENPFQLIYVRRPPHLPPNFKSQPFSKHSMVAWRCANPEVALNDQWSRQIARK